MLEIFKLDIDKISTGNNRLAQNTQPQRRRQVRNTAFALIPARYDHRKLFLLGYRDQFGGHFRRRFCQRIGTYLDCFGTFFFGGLQLRLNAAFVFC